MNERYFFTTANSAIVEPIEELSGVCLIQDTRGEDGLLPAGTRGTVVAVLGAGDAYMVEISAPFHAVLTVGCDAIRPLTGETRADLVAGRHALD